MKTIQYIVFVLAVILSTNLSHAESIIQNFNTLYDSGNGPLTLSADSKTGTTPEVTYTCSGGAAKFWADGTKTSGRVCIFMENSGAQVVTTAVNDLDSLVISYYPSSVVDFYIYTSPDGNEPWTLQTQSRISGSSSVKMAVPGSYYIKVARQSTNFYIWKMEYWTKPCNCLRVVSE